MCTTTHTHTRERERDTHAHTATTTHAHAHGKGFREDSDGHMRVTAVVARRWDVIERAIFVVALRRMARHTGDAFAIRVINEMSSEQKQVGAWLGV